MRVCEGYGRHIETYNQTRTTLDSLSIEINKGRRLSNDYQLQSSMLSQDGPSWITGRNIAWASPRLPNK